MEDLPDGIYFDLPHDIYVALPRMGSTGVKDMICSTATFWHRSWLNKNRPSDDLPKRDPKSIGTAYHMAQLEPDRFRETYARGFDPSEHIDDDDGGFLATDTAVCEVLKDLGETQRKKGESALDRAYRLAEIAPQYNIAAILEAEHIEDNFGKILLPPDLWSQAEFTMKLMQTDPSVVTCLSGGFAEVTILWTSDNGVKMRARIDYLTAHRWCDLKTFSNPLRKPVDVLINNAFRFNGYMSQAALYDEGVEQIRRGNLQVKWYHDGGVSELSNLDESWSALAMIEKIRAMKSPLLCFFVFVQSDGSPNILTRQVLLRDYIDGHDVNGAGVDDDTLPEFMTKATQVLTRGRMDVDRARRLFLWGEAAFNSDEPWLPDRAVGTIDEDCFNPHYLEGFEN